MRAWNRWALWVGMAAVVVAPAGCGSGRVSTYPVQGKITFEGKPLRGGGTIAFVPLGNQAGKTAGGEIAADGSYQLMTYTTGDGSMPGEFRVVITQTTDKEPEATPDGKKAPQPVALVSKAERISPVYADHRESPLKATVEAKSPNQIDFDLKRVAAPPPNRGAAVGAAGAGQLALRK